MMPHFSTLMRKIQFSPLWFWWFIGSSCHWIKTIFYRESCYTFPSSVVNLSQQYSFFLITPVPSCWGNSLQNNPWKKILVSLPEWKEHFIQSGKTLLIKPNLLIISSTYLILVILVRWVTHYSEKFSCA